MLQDDRRGSAESKTTERDDSGSQPTKKTGGDVLPPESEEAESQGSFLPPLFSPPSRLFPQDCAICGVQGLCSQCDLEECRNVVHPWCAESAGVAERARIVCPTHSVSRKADWKVQAPGWSSRVMMDTDALKEFKAQDGTVHSGHFCTGSVFWYVFCSQYFPGLEGQRLPPDFSAQYSSLDPKDILQWLETQEGKWTCDQVLTDTEKKLAETREFIATECAEIARTQEHKSALQIEHLHSKARITEDEWVLKDIKLVEYKRVNREYLKYFESKERVVLPDHVSMCTRSLDPQSNDEDFPCAICGDGDYEDDDLIVICSSCELGVHVKCYGIETVPEDDWLCDMCKVFGAKASIHLPCVFCPIKGGVLKQTAHPNDGSLPFPHYPVYDNTIEESESNPKTIWCHIFCMLRVPKVVIGDRDHLENIRLENVEARRCKLKCEVCGSRNGACIKCGQKKCSAAFHPGCGKTFFLYTGGKLGKGLENEIFCSQHSTFKLRKLVEMKERCQINEIAAFFREWEKWKPKWMLRTSDRRLWSPEESQLLEERIKLFLVASCCDPRTPFTITVQMSAPYASVQMPVVCNLMEPKVIVQNAICIPGRTPEECAKYYETELYGSMQKGLKEIGEPILLLQGKKKKKLSKKKKVKSSKHSKPASERSEVRKRKDGRRSEKRRDKSPKKRKRVVPPVVYNPDPLMTEEVFCICRRPYVQSLPQLLGESEENYALKISSNSMIQCMVCMQWFHLGCMGYPGTPEDAEHDETWECKSCAEAALLKGSGKIQIIVEPVE